MKLQKIHKKIYILILLVCIILVSVFSGFVPVEHLYDYNERGKYINDDDIDNTIKQIFIHSKGDEEFKQIMAKLNDYYVNT